MQHQIRPVTKVDLNGLKEVLDSIDLFPSEFLDDMISDYLTNPNTEALWFTAIDKGRPIAIGFCAPEKFAVGTYNLYAIGIKKDAQRIGVGAAMMRYIEQVLRQNKNRVLIVETSGSKELEPARNFYRKLNYSEEAVIRDFWGEGEDKVIYWKKLRE